MAKDLVKLHLSFLICLPASLASFIRIRSYCGLERGDLDDQSSMALQARKLHYSLLHIRTYISSPYEMHGYVEPRNFPAGFCAAKYFPSQSINNPASRTSWLLLNRQRKRRSTSSTNIHFYHIWLNGV